METLLGLLVGALVVGLAAWLIQEFRWRQRNAELRGQLTRAQDAEQVLEMFKGELPGFLQLSVGDAVKGSTQQLVTLANENFGKTLVEAKGELEKSGQRFQELVKPLSENYAKLNPNIESLMAQNRALIQETAGLRGALSDNRQVGTWGEIQLKRIIELAGMVDYCDFAEQRTVDDGSGRPDVTVRLPDERVIVIDSKASASAYLEAQEAENEKDAAAALNRHANALQAKVTDLARKDYPSHVDGSLPFVVMFVPGDQFLAAALSANSGLIEYAIRNRIAISTPSSLISLLWAVANGWERQRLAENAEEIRKAGVEMHNRLQVFMGHYRRVGEQLGRAAQSFNASVGSFDRNVMPQARRFDELPGVSADVDALPPHIDGEIRDSAYGAEASDDGPAGPRDDQ